MRLAEATAEGRGYEQRWRGGEESSGGKRTGVMRGVL